MLSTVNTVNLKSLVMLHEMSKLIGNHTIFMNSSFNQEVINILKSYEKIQQQICADELIN